MTGGFTTVLLSSLLLQPATTNAAATSESGFENLYIVLASALVKVGADYTDRILV
ncbi:hypothetical protein JCM19233_4717 [Vibrio astriarenae]|nr:hypothetical protein JCM19233_4717 [Vibrio sp. C7]